MKYNCTNANMYKIENIDNIKYQQSCKAVGVSDSAGGNTNWNDHVGKLFGGMY